MCSNRLTECASAGTLKGSVSLPLLRSAQNLLLKKKKYDQDIDSQSAYEILNSKLDEAANRSTPQAEDKRPVGRPAKPEKSAVEEVLENRCPDRISF